MKFKIAEAVAVEKGASVRVGNVYPAKGGARRRTAMWVVIGINKDTQYVHLVGLNDMGEMRSTCSYGMHAMESREVIGRVEGLDDLEFVVEPLP